MSIAAKTQRKLKSIELLRLFANILIFMIFLYLFSEFFNIVVDENPVIPYEVFRRFISGKGF